MFYLTEQCDVDDWSEWSECVPTTPCKKSQMQALSYPVSVATWDKGRVRMERMMKEKTAAIEYERQCLKEGACPELMSLSSDGPYKCQNGKLNLVILL